MEIAIVIWEAPCVLSLWPYEHCANAFSFDIPLSNCLLVLYLLSKAKERQELSFIILNSLFQSSLHVVPLLTLKRLFDLYYFSFIWGDCVRLLFIGCYSGYNSKQAPYKEDW